MRTSDDIAALGEALAQAQAQIEGARKSAANPHLRSRYADLAAVWDACREALTAHGLAVVQAPETGEGLVRVTTRLVHASGQWMESTLALPWSAGKGTTDAQAIGSAITYARRYALSAMVGIAPDDDDDGQAAGQRHRPQERRQRPQERPDGTAKGEHHPSWPEAQAAYCAALRELGLDYPTAAKMAEDRGRPRPSAMHPDQRQAYLDWLRTDRGREAIAKETA